MKNSVPHTDNNPYEQKSTRASNAITSLKTKYSIAGRLVSLESNPGQIKWTFISDCKLDLPTKFIWQ
jgi:hypothetical protein